MKRIIFVTLFAIVGAMTVVNAQKAELSMAGGNRFYSNGARVSVSQFSQELSTVPEAQQMFVKGRELKTLGNVIIWPGIIAVGYQVVNTVAHEASIRNNKTGSPNVNYTPMYKSPIFYVGVGLIVTGVICNSSGKNQMRKSVKMYNSAPNPIAFEVGPSERGLGLCLTF